MMKTKTPKFNLPSQGIWCHPQVPGTPLVPQAYGVYDRKVQTVSCDTSFLTTTYMESSKMMSIFHLDHPRWPLGGPRSPLVSQAYGAYYRKVQTVSCDTSFLTTICMVSPKTMSIINLDPARCPLGGPSPPQVQYKVHI